MDEAGNYYALMKDPSAVVSVSPGGVPRFRVSSRVKPLAVASGVLVGTTDGYWNVEAVDAATLAFLGSVPDVRVVLSHDALFSLRRGERGAYHLTRISLETFETVWDVHVVDDPGGGSTSKHSVSVSPPVLTSAGTLLLVEQEHSIYEGPFPAYVHEIDVDGGDRGRARLSEGWNYGAVTLVDGLMVTEARDAPGGGVVIRAFDVPGRTPAIASSRSAAR
jgi:hypothetical protein